MATKTAATPPSSVPAPASKEFTPIDLKEVAKIVDGLLPRLKDEIYAQVDLSGKPPISHVATEIQLKSLFLMGSIRLSTVTLRVLPDAKEQAKIAERLNYDFSTFNLALFGLMTLAATQIIIAHSKLLTNSVPQPPTRKTTK